MIDWKDILGRLREYPPKVHEIHSSCPLERTREVEESLGKLPLDILNMVHLFNGADLFIKSGELFALFGMSMPTDPTDLDWFIDRYTACLRGKLIGPTDWVIGIYNYGGLMILGEDSIVRQWDRAQRIWSPETYEYSDWIQRLLKEGDDFLNEE